MTMRFEPIEIEWEGKQFTIPSNRVLEAIARIEDHVTTDELQSFARRKTINRGRIALALSSLLTYAGVEAVNSAEVYRKICAPETQDESARLLAVIQLLMTILQPPRKLEAKGGEGNADPAKS